MTQDSRKPDVPTGAHDDPQAGSIPGVQPGVPSDLLPDLLRIATRRSPLALWQAEHVQQRLRESDQHSELVPMSTRGDEMLGTSLVNLGGKGLFLKELEKGILAGQADIAVHSMKDVPAECPDGLIIASILPRAAAGDALVLPATSPLTTSVTSDGEDAAATLLDGLGRGAHIGTCSLRRRCQLLAWRPDLKVSDLRGNVNSRLGRLDAGEFDAIVLATAGLERLGLSQRISAEFPISRMLPACAQGAIGIECRADDAATMAMLAQLHDPHTALAVTAERAMNATLGGSCHTPIGAYAVWHGNLLQMQGMVGAIDGSTLLRESGEVEVADRSAGTEVVAQLGRDIAAALVERGAKQLLQTPVSA